MVVFRFWLGCLSCLLVVADCVVEHIDWFTVDDWLVFDTIAWV